MSRVLSGVASAHDGEKFGVKHARRLILSAVGTLGDALPLVAVGNKLASRGYEVHLLTNHPLASDKLSSGVRLTQIAPPQLNNLAPLQHNLETYHFASYAPCYEFFEDLDRETVTVVVNTMNLSATNALAELYGLSIFRLVLAPFHVPSLISPPSPMREAALGPMGHTFRTYTLPAIYGRRDTSTRLLDPINRYRRAWGLEPISVLQHAERFVCRYAGMFPEWFGQPAADWPEHFSTMGFPLAETPGSLPREVDDFIAGAGAPLVFTPGTGVTDVQKFFSHAAECCERLRQPGLFLSRSLALGAYGPAIKVAPYVDLELVLPRARLIVHHGGIGTTARALQAGVPQVVVPVAYDQPDNARRIAELNAGMVITPEALDADTLTDAVARLLGDPCVAETIARLKAKVAEQDALESVARALDAQFESEVNQRARAGRQRPQQKEVTYG